MPTIKKVACAWCGKKFTPSVRQINMMNRKSIYCKKICGVHAAKEAQKWRERENKGNSDTLNTRSAATLDALAKTPSELTYHFNRIK